MMKMQRQYVGLLATATALLPLGCGSVGQGHTGPTPADMELDQISNGFGQLVPHRIFELDEEELPTSQIVSIRSFEDLTQNLRGSNRILPVTQWSATATLPDGSPGNHFIFAKFKRPIDIASVLDPTPGGVSNSGLTGSLTVVAIDPISGDTIPVRGRAFVNGYTYALPLDPNASIPTLTLQRWVEVLGSQTAFPRISARRVDSRGSDFSENDADHADTAQPGLGFPGSEQGASFQGAIDLVGSDTLVFVVDSDNDLSGATSYETFPLDVQIRMRVGTAVTADNGARLERTALGCATVGKDELSPEVRKSPPPLNDPLVTPKNGDIDVDPLSNIIIEFTEPVQPLDVGDLDDGTPPSISSSVLLEFGPSARRTTVPFTVRPISVFDLSTYELIPTFSFPGSGPDMAQCGTFSTIDITINPATLHDLSSDPSLNPETPGNANQNILGGISSFLTGAGPGIVNAPVTPDAIYLGRTGAVPGLSVVDLNGSGAGTGNPSYSQEPGEVNEGDSNYPNNPNLKFQGAQMRPPLTPGTCTIDGGSAGALTLTRDSSLMDLVQGAPAVTDVADMMIGHSLDSAFNNSPFPFGCQSGGGSLCTLDGLKIIRPAYNGGATVNPSQTLQVAAINPGSENIVAWAPHPNPPPLVFPPLCVSPFLGGEEPTSVDTTTIVGLSNLLAPGDAFGNPEAGLPPGGLLTLEQNNYFLGPSLPQQTIQSCAEFQIRQQVGQFLYVADRQRAEVLVLNSNRMSVIDRIPIPDPTDMAMGTNLDFLAVSNQQANTVSFIDINPNSSTFHQVIKETEVGESPRGIAWDPGNEDILVCNELAGSMSIISVNNFEVRRVIQAQMNQPFDVAITPRQVNASHGFSRGVYFAYIMNRSGVVAFYESGPNGINGWGFDDVIGVAPMVFHHPKAIQPDHTDLRSAVWIAHEGPINVSDQSSGLTGIPAVSNLEIESALQAQIPLNINGFLTPGLRDIVLAVNVSLGPETLSGIPVDLAFDNLRNLTGLQNVHTDFSAGSPSPVNGKNLVRYNFGATLPTNTPRFMFVAVPNTQGSSGVIDVIEIGAAGFPNIDVNAHRPGRQSIEAANTLIVCDFFRQ
ncbi:MAG: hypothetical protein ACI841_005066 [Planctomycetota bacterium]|jgi:hypothetical protein